MLHISLYCIKQLHHANVWCSWGFFGGKGGGSPSCGQSICETIIANSCKNRLIKCGVWGATNSLKSTLGCSGLLGKRTNDLANPTVCQKIRRPPRLIVITPSK